MIYDEKCHKKILASVRETEGGQSASVRLYGRVYENCQLISSGLKLKKTIV